MIRRGESVEAHQVCAGCDPHSDAAANSVLIVSGTVHRRAGRKSVTSSMPSARGANSCTRAASTTSSSTLTSRKVPHH